MTDTYRTLGEVRDHFDDLVDEYGEDAPVKCDADGVHLDGVQTHVEDDTVVVY